MNLIIAAYCFQGTFTDHQVVLITSTTGRWIIPKGQPENQLRKRDVALSEAWEEAGVQGELAGKASKSIVKRGSEALWMIYPVKVTFLAENWPEKPIRRRVLLSPEDAIREIDNPSLAKAVRKLANKLQNS
jgi:8-oxo-dGTP pyrophosphatase MutT (NUDIX family)